MTEVIENKMKYARVASSFFSGSGFDYLDYIVPQGMTLKIGDGVIVPLRNQAIFGYVIKITDNSDIESDKLLYIYEKIDESQTSVTREVIELAGWVSSNYLAPLSKTITSVIPSGMQSKVKYSYELNNKSDLSHLTPSERELLDYIAENKDFKIQDIISVLNKPESSIKRLLRSLEKKSIILKKWYLASNSRPKYIKCIKISEVKSDKKLTVKQSAALDFIKLQTEPIPCVFMVNNKIASNAILNILVTSGICEFINVQIERIPAFSQIARFDIELSKSQKNAIEQISCAIDNACYKTFLIHGVTASGKTEVYMALIKKIIEKGKTALVLLPEIALTTQVMNIFKSRFGELVAVLHSALSEGERFDEWQRVKNNKVKIVLGARSAVFSPINNLGIIIIDEEHDSGYKQDTIPKYHTRDVAGYRAEYNNAVLVLGSATPSIESYFKAVNGDYELVEMPERVSDKQLPKVYISDLTMSAVDKSSEKKSPTIFSDLLYEKIKDRLEKKQQIMLMQNRRAFSTFILCRDCGWVAKCIHCDVSLKYHKKAGKLTCHHCDYKIDIPQKCPVCDSLKINAFGIGTQRVEEFVKLSFPNARVLRMDKDTTTGRGSHQKIISEFRNGNADILIGTQMIAKGLDFPNVTLVGIISADTDLNIPDFRSGERTFQLINQVAGRSGRGIELGEVIVQTFAVDNYAIQNACNNNYQDFYLTEIKEREELFYPPYSRIIKISSQGKDANEVKEYLDMMYKELFEYLLKNKVPMDSTRLYPVMPSIIPKLNDIYKFNFLIKTRFADDIKKIIKKVISKDEKLRRNLIFDIDPMFLE